MTSGGHFADPVYALSSLASGVLLECLSATEIRYEPVHSSRMRFHSLPVFRASSTTVSRDPACLIPSSLSPSSPATQLTCHLSRRLTRLPHSLLIHLHRGDRCRHARTHGPRFSLIPVVTCGTHATTEGRRKRGAVARHAQGCVSLSRFQSEDL